MLAFTLARIIQSIPLVFGATIVVFVLMRMVPGDPASIYAGPEAPQEVIQAVRKNFGLDKPLPLQYTSWLSKVLRGDLGKSYLSSIPVSDLLKQRIPATLELTFAAMLPTILIGIPSGVVAALKSGGRVDAIITTFAGLNVALPSFWLGILAIYFFSVVLDWLPPGGRVSITSDPIQGAKYLLLPAVTLSLVTTAALSRLVKSAMLEVLHEDYVRTARSKGLTNNQVILHHILRNAMVPVITVLSFQFGRLLGGAIVIESVFAWPGVGRLVLSSLANRDYAVIQGVLLTLVLVFIAINLVTDIAYGLLDPRIRVGTRSDQ
jgi:peptide/nickel transport system permease protein